MQLGYVYDGYAVRITVLHFWADKGAPRGVVAGCGRDFSFSFVEEGLRFSCWPQLPGVAGTAGTAQNNMSEEAKKSKGNDM